MDTNPTPKQRNVCLSKDRIDFNDLKITQTTPKELRSSKTKSLDGWFIRLRQPRTNRNRRGTTNLSASRGLN